MEIDYFAVGQLLFLVIQLIFYHVTEYKIQKHFHPDTTDASSFLITKEYLIAFSCGAIEFIAERYFFPFKSDPRSLIIWLGVVMIFIGLYIRFTAIITAGKSFTHLIATKQRTEHKLITHGIYRYIRHPSYLGFFVFAVGTQLMLQNIISLVGFVVVLFYFFKDRIEYEEEFLIKFFGQEYIDYKSKTKTWIPFIK